MIHNNEYIQKKSKHIIKLIMSQTFHGFNEMLAVTFLTTLTGGCWKTPNTSYTWLSKMVSQFAIHFFFLHVLWHSWVSCLNFCLWPKVIDRRVSCLNFCLWPKVFHTRVSCLNFCLWPKVMDLAISDSNKNSRMSDGRGENKAISSNHNNNKQKKPPPSPPHMLTETKTAKIHIIVYECFIFLYGLIWYF